MPLQAMCNTAQWKPFMECNPGWINETHQRVGAHLPLIPLTDATRATVYLLVFQLLVSKWPSTMATRSLQLGHGVFLLESLYIGIINGSERGIKVYSRRWYAEKYEACVTKRGTKLYVHYFFVCFLLLASMTWTIFLIALQFCNKCKVRLRWLEFANAKITSETMCIQWRLFQMFITRNHSLSDSYTPRLGGTWYDYRWTIFWRLYSPLLDPVLTDFILN